MGAMPLGNPQSAITLLERGRTFLFGFAGQSSFQQLLDCL